MLRTLLIVIIGIVIVHSANATVDEPQINNDIDVVWSSSDGLKMEIFYSQRKDGIWLEPVLVTDDHYDNMYPVIDRDSSGKRWIFWTAYDNGRMEIHYTAGDGEEWKTSEVLSTEEKTNLSPSVVIDKQDRIWVVWSANTNKLDDIMYAFYQGGSWTDPAFVHEPNEAPDLLPEIEIGGDGTPQVIWRAVREGQNIVLSSKWTDNDWSDPVIEEFEAVDKQDSEDKIIELPQFVNQSSRVFVRVY